MKRFVRFLTVFAAIGATGCKGSTSSPSSPSDDPEVNPLYVVSVSPVNGATRVPIHSHITITFSEALDETTVTRANVVLSPVPSPPALAYDAVTRTITLTPASGMNNYSQPYAGLYNNVTYTLALSGLRDQAGHQIVPVTFTFTTYRDLMIRMVQYSGGAISSYRAYAYDAAGLETSEIQYTGPGPGGIWFEGNDDVVGSSRAYAYNDAQVRIVDRYGPPTASEAPSGYCVSSYDAIGNQLRTVYYGGTGPDGVWFGTGTDWFATDDAVSCYFVQEYDAQGRIARTSYFTSPGTDGTWFTSDDAPVSYWTYAYDPDGNQTLSTSYDAADQVTGITWNTFDSRRLPVRTESRSADATLLSYATLTYDAAGNWTEMDMYSAADVLNAREVYFYDPDGNTTGMHWYDGQGNLVVSQSFDTSQ